MANARKVIEAALAARTLGDAQAVQRLVEQSIGARYERPLGDRWNNFGLITSTGSYDHKALEPVTNMQDSVLERFAAASFPRSRLGAVQDAGGSGCASCSAAATDREIADDVTVTLHEAEPPAENYEEADDRLSRSRLRHRRPPPSGNTIFALGSSHKTKSVWQQGAFGLGGASTFRNADAIILVTRRAPEMKPDEDRISCRSRDVAGPRQGADRLLPHDDRVEQPRRRRGAVVGAGIRVSRTSSRARTWPSSHTASRVTTALALATSARSTPS